METRTAISRTRAVAVLFLVAGHLLPAGCAKYYKKSADKEVNAILSEKDKAIEGMPSHFTIEREGTPKWSEESSTSPVVLSLADAMELAVENSRSYQSWKESLFSQALSLTLARHEWDPLFSGVGSGKYERKADRDSISGVFAFGIKKMIETGADLSLSLTSNFFRYIDSGDPQRAAASAISATLTQPFLKGAGRKVALENLTQAERDMVYALRSFVRYRRTFSLDVAKSYYNLLRQKDQLKNAWSNYQNLKTDRERAELLGQAGRMPDFQVDQTKQRELQARDNWISSQQRYQTSLDRFKLDLGIPMQTALGIDPDELGRLSARGLVPVPLSIDEATSLALERRVDLATTREKVEDAARKVEVATNGLLPKADLTLFYHNQTANPDKPFHFNQENDSHGVEIDAELPLDKKADRNRYRQSLINLETAQRDFSEKIDLTKLEIHSAFLNLEQAQERYQIQLNSLRLAERRVDSTKLLLQAGRANARDVLDAQDSLLEAQNAVTNVLVDYISARLDLFLATETLRIDDNGLWQEESSHVANN